MYDEAISIGDKVIESNYAESAITRFNHWKDMNYMKIKIVSLFGTWANNKFILRIKYEVLQ